jgi:hypothetical protein
MRGRFFLSLAHALLAGLATVAWLAVAGPVIGGSRAVLLLALPLAAAHVFVIAPNWAVGVRAGLTVFFVGVVPWLLGLPAAACWLGPILGLALVRSGWLFRRSLVRAVAVEVGLAAAGFLLARLLVGPTVLGWGLAFWAFFLVQSLFFLVADLEEGPAGDPRAKGDAFELAHRRALEILEGR